MNRYLGDDDGYFCGKECGGIIRIHFTNSFPEFTCLS